ncbi:hypothetical protein DDB_G0271636 [Dictyostelium discoideum AX4]|uniref:EGF-like domain-containing protein n=1 Tax=Dictyostelium discoideum TaxID=44689 RepID=Q55AW5_DICDI|nr:hypothetical protein DDB_G0271636 [Dictyostelium discoideum AX4]EAL71682.1 hypothetical protein DDB_G0271636 [Dictyostelium discoideum AX4]|eukprot:XP_645581.1 hypothetical protein DDB_G0271636 [Dictyostelium discoideum AX4]
MFGDNPSPEYFCVVYYCSPITGSIIGPFKLIGDPSNQSNEVMTHSDLKNFTNISSMELVYFKIDEELLYIKLNNVEKVGFIFVNGVKEINRTLADYKEIVIDSRDLENSTFKLSYINNDTAKFQIKNSFLEFENDLPDLPSLTNLLLEIRSLPNISQINPYQVSFRFSPDFDIGSLKLNFQTLKSQLITILDSNDSNLIYPCDFIKDQYVGQNEKSTINFGLKFLPPIDGHVIDLSNKNIESISYTNAGNAFNIVINSKSTFPILVGYYVNVALLKGNISQTIPLSQFGRGESISVIDSKISGDLDTNYRPTDGVVRRLYDFSNNFITGTIDPSWCNAQLIIRNNKMSGEVPSCYSCYFNYPMQLVNNPDIKVFYDGFEGNNFTNLEQNLKCTTFAPQIDKDSETSLIISGTDIGFYGDKFLIQDTMICTTYQVIEFGKSYKCGIHPSFSFKDLNYIKINFKFPFDKDYYFSLINRVPMITSVTYSNNNLQINGSYFSSYLGHVPQTISLSTFTFDILNSSDFFSIQAISTFKVVPNPGFNLLTLKTNSKISRVFINMASLANDKLCKNNCTDDDHGVCNLYLGTCVCNNNYEGDDCSIPQFYITSVQPSTTNGGEAIFFGLYGYDLSNISLTISGIDCPITFNSSDTIKCIAPPGNGIKTVILKQNIKIFTGIGIYKYIELSIPCPNKCSNNGICNSTTGICKCKNGYTLYDCSALLNTDIGLGNNNNNNNNNGGTNTTIDPGTGSTNITDSQTNFQIYLKSLIEVDINNNEVKSYSLLKNWIFNKTENEIEPNKYILKQQLVNNTSTTSNGCIITSTIEEIKDKNGKEFTFAGTSFVVSSGSIKFTISIANYTYQSNLNTLKLELISSVDKIDKINNCNSKDTEIDTTNVNDISTFNYIKISKNKNIFSGRFINKVLSDGRSTFFTTSARNDSNSIIVSLNLPHCINECLIDPDFSVLLSNDFKSECGDDDSSRKWFLPVVVVVPVVGFALILIILLIIYKKSTTFKIILHATKLKKLKNNK